MFDLERGKRTLPSLPDPDVKPPYPIEMLSYPYPEGYTVPKFIKFDGKQGNTREHVVRFIETLGIHGSNHKSEDILDYVKRFQDKAVDSHKAVEESYLVQICLEGALSRLASNRLVDLLLLLPLPQIPESHKEEVIEARRESNIMEVKALVKEWVADGELKLPYVEEMPSKKDRGSPEFCVYHRTLKHSIEKCCTLRKIFRDKVEADELRFKKQGTQDIREQPYPQHRDKGKNVAMIAYDGPMIEAIANLDDDDYYLDDILEPKGEQVYYGSALDSEGRTFITHVDDPFDPEGGEEYYGRGGHHVYVASYFEETEEMVNYEPPRVEKDPDHYAKTLQGCVKFKQFFDQLGLSREARTEITKFIINIAEAHHEECMSTEGSILRKAKE
ncbi:hypothetical protein HYC85_030368 [Camellia sinensis]|uniref:Uncharacterized protein n=1 Tax=Camellia sinensis TaxID=4442 RepID=A0A7J7G172_CAMSI|nr:hypothetical protein HYC85_030368 [Camellia sinensis]